MALETQHWYHCGRCGNLFSASNHDTLCDRCGQPPTPDQALGEVKENAIDQRPVKMIPAVQGETSDHSQPARVRSVKKEKTDYFLVKLSVGWLCFLALFVILIYKVKDPGKWMRRTQAQRFAEATADFEKATTIADNQRIFNSAQASISTNTTGLLDNISPESRAQHVLQTKNVVLSILHDGGKTKLLGSDANIQIESTNVIRIHDTPRIEILWKDEKGRRVEMVYAEEDQEWKIDWEAFAKSSTETWTMFDSGEEPKTGTFRFLVRERLAENFALNNQLSIVFYEPSFWNGVEPITQTPEFLLDRDSTIAKQIIAALNAKKNKQPIYNTMFSQKDPEGMARVRVTIERKVNGKEKIFTIKSVDALHWMNVNDFGLELDVPKIQEAPTNP